MNKYFDLVISALALGMGSGCAVYLATPTVAPAVVSGLATFSASIVQQMRQWPREVWTDEQRKEKA